MPIKFFKNTALLYFWIFNGYIFSIQGRAEGRTPPFPLTKGAQVEMGKKRLKKWLLHKGSIPFFQFQSWAPIPRFICVISSLGP